MTLLSLTGIYQSLYLINQSHFLFQHKYGSTLDHFSGMYQLRAVSLRPPVIQMYCFSDHVHRESDVIDIVSL